MTKLTGRLILLAVALGLILPCLPGCSKEGKDPILDKRDGRNAGIADKQDKAASGE